MKVLTTLLSMFLLAIISGCGSSLGSPSPLSPVAAKIDAGQFKLAEEPDGAVGVITARESAEDGASLVVVGCIGGSATPWIEGRAAFTLIDASMTIVAEGEDAGGGEICMGNCCAAERLHCTTLVKIVDDQGELVPIDSRELLKLSESDMVVVEGTAKRDDSGNFVVLGKGVYVRE